MSGTTRRRFDEIRWSTTPSDMIVRLGGDMVHRVLQLVGSNVHGDEVVLECGARAPKGEATETEDPVDCMACMIRRTTEAMEAEWAADNAAMLL
jgi:uncharacterized Fe-S center protein